MLLHRTVYRGEGCGDTLLSVRDHSAGTPTEDGKPPHLFLVHRQTTTVMNELWYGHPSLMHASDSAAARSVPSLLNPNRPVPLQGQKLATVA